MRSLSVWRAHDSSALEMRIGSFSPVFFRSELISENKTVTFSSFASQIDICTTFIDACSGGTKYAPSIEVTGKYPL